MKKVLVVGGVVLVLGAGWFFLRGGKAAEASDELYATVVEGPLVISVEEFGEIRPSQEIVLKNEVQGRVSIITLVPEGTMVKEGDVLVQLDVSSKIDEKDSQEITLQNAKSALEVAREELEIQKNQAASDVELAEEAFLFAKEDLEKYEKGEYPSTLIDKKGQIALKEQQVKQAKDKYEWSKRLFEEKFISETELEGDELSWKSSQLTLESAQRDLEVLETYTHRRDLAKFRSDVKQKEMALLRTRKRAASSIAKAESDLRGTDRSSTRRADATASRCRKARRCGSVRSSSACRRRTPSRRRSTCTRATSRALRRACRCACAATRCRTRSSRALSPRSPRCRTTSGGG